ncbi:MAG: cell division protein FtsA [Nitrospiraceae bacterium]|nr:cell division protein FtsA [Nitrospiraceae bacterium]
MKGRYIAGIDLGSTKVCLMVGRVGRGGVEIVGAASVASQGLRKGVVVDIDETANSINLAVKEVRSASGVDIRAAYVGISGGHIKSHESYGATGIKGKEVGPADLDRVIESASALYVPLDREVLHVLPSEFIIDGQDGISKPFGMAGVRLEVKVQVLTASQAALENIGRALERSGLRALEMVFQPLAGSMAVLRDDELQQGVLLIDMGGGVTDVALFKGGALRWAGVIPVGGAHTTNDIAVGLQLPQKEAERLKLRQGLGPETLKVNLFESEESVEAKSMNGKARQVPHAELARIIRLRTEELFELVKDEAEPQIIRHQPLCAVITGGASQMKDIAPMAERWLGLPVRTGLPERFLSQGGLFAEALRDPGSATAAGLLLYGFDAEGGAAALQGHPFSDSIETLRQTVIEQGSALAKKLMGKVRRFEWGAHE